MFILMEDVIKCIAMEVSFLILTSDL